MIPIRSYIRHFYFFVLVLFPLRKRRSYLPLCDNRRRRKMDNRRQVRRYFALRTHQRAAARARCVVEWEFIYKISLPDWVRLGSGNDLNLIFSMIFLRSSIPKYFESYSTYVASHICLPFLRRQNSILLERHYLFLRVICIYAIKETCGY
jgi:hypothetical protein